MGWRVGDRMATTSLHYDGSAAGQPRESITPPPGSVESLQRSVYVVDRGRAAARAALAVPDTGHQFVHHSPDMAFMCSNLLLPGSDSDGIAQIDREVEVTAWIPRGPGRSDLAYQMAALDGFHEWALHHDAQVPVSVREGVSYARAQGTVLRDTTYQRMVKHTGTLSVVDDLDDDLTAVTLNEATDRSGRQWVTATFPAWLELTEST